MIRHSRLAAGAMVAWLSLSCVLACTGSNSNLNSSGGGGTGGGSSSQGSADSTANSVQGSIGATSQGTADSSAQSTRASGPVLSTVAVGVTVVGVGYLIWGPATRASFAVPPPVPPPPAPAAMAEIRPQNLERFGRLLREHRSELIAWTDARALTPAAAERVLRRIGEIASGDGALAEDGRAFLERHPGT